MNRRRVLAGAAAIATGVCLAAILAGARAGDAAEGGTFRMALSVGAGFQSIDPALYALEFRILRPACGALMSYPDKPLPAGLRLEPELAESYPIVSGDRRTYTFTIRKDARFSTGAAVTARDFTHSLERIFDPKVGSGSTGFEDVVGARELLAGKATRLAGAVANGRTLRLRLTRPGPDLFARTSLLCAVPSAVPADPEGEKAPLPSPAPYYVSAYVPGVRVVLERNRFYRGPRPHHVDRIEVDLQGDASAVGDVADGTLDSVGATPDLSPQLRELARRYGVNRSRLFIEPMSSLRCSSSLRAVRCSGTTSSSGRRSTSPWIAGRSSTSTDRTRRPRPTTTSRESYPASETGGSIHFEDPT
jgi:ABC-type transport system substrate-binding protein